MCGLLATVMDAYCIDQLTSTPETRERRSWSKWWRQRNDKESRCPSCSSNSSIQDVELEDANLVTGRVSVFVEHLNEEVVHPIGVLSPNAGLPQPPPQDPPSYDEIGESMRVSEDGVVRGAPEDPRQSIFARARANPPNQGPQIQDLPSWRRKPGISKYLWKGTTYTMFILCLVPVILSCSLKPLIRDSVYRQACDGYGWKIILDANDGLETSPSGASNLPVAKFIDLLQTNLTDPTNSFTMEMSLEKPKLQAQARENRRQRRNIIPSLGNHNRLKSPEKIHHDYDRFFYLQPDSYNPRPDSRPSKALLSLVSYDTAHHVYNAVFGSPSSSAIVGDYHTEPQYAFPRLRLLQAPLERQDHFGFPRVVLRNGNGEKMVLTTRTKRGSCTQMKVCVRKEISAVEAAIAVGPLLLKHIEASGKCQRG